uniref:RING-type domain-containing protein n=1 Tax=Strigamia maritima TaxID=126957 RepID=T1J958_STRMM
MNSAESLSSDEDDTEHDIADRGPHIPGMIAVPTRTADSDDENHCTDGFRNNLREVTSVVDTLKEMHPDFVVDPNEVFELIELEGVNVNRKNIVIDKLIAKRLNDTSSQKNGTSSQKNGTEKATASTENNNVPDKFQELLSDVDVVKRFVPNKSREEIYAYLEAFHENPNRIRIVIGELLNMNGMAPFPLDNPVNNNTQRLNMQQPIASTSAERTEQSNIMDRVNSIMELFPDADPNSLWNFVEKYSNDVNYINATVSAWWESRSYPKLAEVQKAATKRKFMESDFSIEEFLEMFPDPENYFKNTDRVITPSYKMHVQSYVENQFRFAYKVDLTAVMEKHKFHLTPILKELNSQWNVSAGDEPLAKKRKEAVKKKKKMTILKPMPTIMDELFYKEKFFLEMEDKIKKYKKDKEVDRRKKIEMAKEKGELLTCDCCFEDELLIEDMLHCSDGHLFCKMCIRRQAEFHIGQGKYKFPCLDPYCKNEFPLIALQNVLAPNIFSNLVRKMQEEEIRQAEIPDLVSCPYCTFCTVIADPNIKIFRCLNPECLKVTCRLCKEPNHLPLRCDEIEQKPEVQFRTFIEDQMTDALLRTCPRCKCRIIKDTGCNKMTCTCGQAFCYVCREPIKDYHHFSNGRCPQYSNDVELNRLEVQESAKKARQEYIEIHPELTALNLRHDPTKAPDLAQQRHQQQQANAHGAMPMLNDQGQIIFQRPRGTVGAVANVGAVYRPMVPPARPMVPPARPMVPPARPMVPPARPMVPPASPMMPPARRMIRPMTPFIRPAVPVVRQLVRPAEQVIRPTEQVIRPTDQVITARPREINDPARQPTGTGTDVDDMGIEGDDNGGDEDGDEYGSDEDRRDEYGDDEDRGNEYGDDEERGDEYGVDAYGVDEDEDNRLNQSGSEIESAMSFTSFHSNVSDDWNSCIDSTVRDRSEGEKFEDIDDSWSSCYSDKNSQYNSFPSDDSNFNDAFYSDNEM